MSSRTLIGLTLGKYKVVEGLGRGGMAEVYRAYQENLDRDVAIKVMHSFLADEAGFLARFQREAKSMASLNHSNIVSVYDFDVQDGMYYIVMEYVSGGTLKEELESLAKSRGRLPLSKSVQYILEIASALAYAHARGMVHRDIKPGNIMINDQGRAVLTDFGIAKILSGPSFTATGAMIGTPAYMSPEQGLGQPGDERSDLYALGVLLYQMTTGQLPYDADTPLAVILKHVNEPIPEPSKINSDLPIAIQDVMVKAMAKDPAQRYQSAKELAAALKEAADKSNLELGVIVPFDATSDRLTPLPAAAAATVLHQTPAEATVMSRTPPPPTPAPLPADATRVAAAGTIEATEIGVPLIPTQAPAATAVPAAPVAEKKRPWAIIILILFILLVALGAGGFFIFGKGGTEATPEATEVSAALPPTEEPTEAPPSEPQATVDVGATAVAAIAATLTAVPTETPLPTLTAPTTGEVTPDMTATFVASCDYSVELVNSYTFRNQQSSAAPIDSSFPMNWVIRNNGDCPVLAGLAWTYKEGEEFGQSGPVELEEDLEPGEEATLQATLKAPSRTGTYESTWQFIDVNGENFGPKQSFEVLVYVPTTPTPVPTKTPEVSPTASRPFGYNVSVAECNYVETDWQCQMFVEPYGGVGPYRFVTDESPQPVYTGTGPFSHPVVSPRCSPWVHTISVTDEGTGQTLSETRFVDPNVFFAPCVMPPA